ncbi:MAG: hypothetical protein AAF532_03575 [Planctomycetota bacterium]
MATIPINTAGGLTEADADGRYAPLGHTHGLADVTDAGTAASRDVPASGDAAADEVVLGSDSRLGTGGGGGTTDHGALSGLGDDDHPQYLNQARGDARYLSSDSAALFALDGHAHLANDISDLGTAALLDAPAAGDAAAGEVVLGNDTRLAALGEANTTADVGGGTGLTGGKTGSVLEFRTVEGSGGIGVSVANDLITIDGSAIVAGAGALPGGGTAGQVLVKQSGTDFDAAWENPTGGPSSAGGTQAFDEATTSDATFAVAGATQAFDETEP